jgi:hypothetical protein
MYEPSTFLSFFLLLGQCNYDIPFYNRCPCPCPWPLALHGSRSSDRRLTSENAFWPLGR